MIYLCREMNFGKRKMMKTMKIYQFFLLLLSVIVIGGCGSKKNNTYTDVGQKISEAQTNSSKISIAELNKIAEHKGEYQIIDCRETEEYVEGHIPGAVNIPRGLLEFSDKISNRRQTLYVYSQTNDRASLACPSLKLLKHNKVYLVDGGWQEWHKTFPEQIEKGSGDKGNEPAPKVEESGGCGG